MDELSRSVSLDFYRSIVDAGIRKDQLFPVADLVESQVCDQEGQAAAQRFFLGPLNLLTLCLDLPADPATVESQTAVGVEALEQARNDLVAARAGWIDASGRVDECFLRLCRIEHATIAHGAGLKLDLATFGLSSLEPGQVKAVREAITEELGQLDRACAPLGAAAAKRLALALAALRDDARVPQIPDGLARRDDASALYPCLAHLARVYRRSVRSVLRSRSMLSFLAEGIEVGSHPQNNALIEAFQTACDDLAAALERFSSRAGRRDRVSVRARGPEHDAREVHDRPASSRFETTPQVYSRRPKPA